MGKTKQTIPVVGGVDTHKDLHVAAVVDDNDQVLGTQNFATTRQGYKLMLAWMRSFGNLQRIGVECTGSCGAGLLRYCNGTQTLPHSGADVSYRSADRRPSYRA
ncbi:IS110 family transposase ISEc21 [Roseobacter fucihabitans]|uniref:IS110 family transposase ISEc21 n=1 Tax=Roseobacter fucihabitans TaxID=1537242 RepID=A0ABZ2BW53_9RHOB